MTLRKLTRDAALRRGDGAPATGAPATSHLLTTLPAPFPHRLGADGATTPAQSRLVFARCDGAVGGRSRWRATVEAAALEGDRSDASLQRSSGGADASRHPRPIRGESGAQRRPQRGQGRTGVATPRRPGRFARRQRRGYPCWGMFGARGGCSLSVHVAAAAAALGVIVSAQEAPRTPWGDLRGALLYGANLKGAIMSKALAVRSRSDAGKPHFCETRRRKSRRRELDGSSARPCEL